MATIQTSIRLFDGMSPALRSMTNAMNITISSLERMQRTSATSIDTASLHAARTELSQAEISFRRMETSIQRAGQQQERFNQSIERGSVAANGLSGILARVGAVIGVGKIVQMSDTITQTTARLSMMNDKLQSTAELQDKVFASAQRARALYTDTAAAVAKLGLNAGNAFQNNDEIIAFTEQINKSFVIAGASTQAQSSAMIQLTQSMAAGALRGEELNSILDAAPSIARNIERAMGWAEGSIKKYAEQGKVTAQVVKNSILMMSEETNKAFESMPRTWTQVWSDVMNRVVKISQPILSFVNLLANNWSLIEPVVIGAAAALSAFAAVAIFNNSVVAMSALIRDTHAAAEMRAAGATFFHTAAQKGLNATLLACPLTWIVLAVIAFITVIYIAVAAINKFAGTSYSATGFIMGAFAVLGAYIWNTVAYLYNIWAAFANFFLNVFKNPVASVKILFYDLAINVIDYVGKMAKAIEKVINKIPGIKVNMTDGIENFKKKLEKNSAKIKTEADWVEYAPKMKSKDYVASFSKGYEKGKNIAGKATDAFNGAGTETPNMDQLLNNAANTAGNTGKMADSMSMSQEDLKYLRDIAERDIVNRFTTAELKVDMTTYANINNDMDLDGIISGLETKVGEMLVASAEGVHI